MSAVEREARRVRALERWCYPSRGYPSGGKRSDWRGERFGRGVPQAWNDGVGPWEAGDGRMERRGWTDGAGMGSALVGKDERGRCGDVLELGDVWRGAQSLVGAFSGEQNVWFVNRPSYTTVAGVLYGCKAGQGTSGSHGGAGTLVLINGVCLSVKGVGP